MVSIRNKSEEFKMPIQLNEEDGGKLLAVHVNGKLTKAENQQLVPEFKRLVRQHGKLRIFFNMPSRVLA
jgi:hypothetical protein